VVAAAMVLAALLLAPFPAAASDRSVKEAELARLKAHIGALRQELNRARGRYDEIRAELQAVEERIGSVTRELHRLDGRLREQLLKLRGLEQRQTELGHTVSLQRGHLADQVRAAYATGRQEFIKILLNQEQPGEVGRMLTYYDYINRARSERIAALLDSLRELERVQNAIADETRELDALRQREATERERLDATRQERKTVLVALDAEISDKGERLKHMLADERELEALIKALAEALADIPPEAGRFQPFNKLRGQLEWPVKGRRLAAFGGPRGGSDLRWQGVLIGGKAGAPVRAVAGGRVAFADWLRGYGLLLIIDHDDGYMTLYGHNESLYKETGDWVETGEVIAALGNSGGHEREALYFEIRHNGRPADPVRWCRR
jgi:septal ring factor EnvC (AmiA/AmiB activator)